MKTSDSWATLDNLVFQPTENAPSVMLTFDATGFIVDKTAVRVPFNFCCY